MRIAPIALAIAAAAGCDAGVPGPKNVPGPKTRVAIARAELAPLVAGALPIRGYAVQSTGVGGAYDVEIVDSEARTLRALVHDPYGKDRDHTIVLDAAQLTRLERLADLAWREVPHGKMPEAQDIVQDLFIVDRQDAFHLQGHPIADVGGYMHSGRPAASDFVIAIQLLAP